MPKICKLKKPSRVGGPCRVEHEAEVGHVIGVYHEAKVGHEAEVRLLLEDEVRHVFGAEYEVWEGLLP